MDATQVFTFLSQSGSALIVALAYIAYTLWQKLLSEQEYARKRDEQLAALLIKVTENMQTIQNGSAEVLKQIETLKQLIVNHLLDYDLENKG